MISSKMREKHSSLFALFSTLVIVAIFSSCKSADDSSANERMRSFDADWRFILDSVNGAEAISYDDSKWRLLDVPHDWSIEDIPQQVEGKTIGPFSKESPGGKSTGHVLGGTGWYRKKFTLTIADTGKLISIYFEGIYMESDVWVNGQHVGYHPYGYTSFSYDLTKHLLPPGQPNVIAVRVVNKGKNSRWYSGSGIYRHVWLSVKNPVHIDQWGVVVTTPEAFAEEAKIKLATTILSDAGKDIKLQTRLIDSSGKEVGKAETSVSHSTAGKNIINQEFNLKNPRLWSPDAPYLYRAVTILFDGGKESDVVVTHFGVRRIEFSPYRGFELNGKQLKLKGGCVHHDNGLLGSAAIDRAEERRIELLKANGFNAIRCSHNPPSEKFLEACDRLGMMVIDESFDHWQLPKNPEDYHRFFDEWWERDITSMVMRDRNHPSIILWSIGNEIQERADPAGLEITKKLKSKVLQLDSTRMITEAICEFWDHPGRKWEFAAPAFELLDVSGYNYQWLKYEPDHEYFPKRILMGTESVPQHAFENWKMVEKHPYVVGDFVWTAMDYLGEAGIGHSTTDTGKMEFSNPWPWFNAYCGDIDLIGNKKPQSYYRDVVWRRSPIELAVHTPLPPGKKEQISYWGWPDEQQSWTWPGNEGKMLDVNVYSRSPLVRLELNGKLIGEKNITDTSGITAKFQVPYQPGILKAIAIENGKDVGSVMLSSRNAPSHIHLIADREKIKASRNDLSYVTIEIVDDQDRVVPNAEVPIRFSVSGDGEIAAVGSANPADMSSFKGSSKKTWRGRCLVILRSTGKAGKIILKVESDALGGAEIVVETD